MNEMISTIRNTVGRYFSLVSAVPSAALVVFGFLLARSGSWTGSPDWIRGFDALTRAGGGTLSVLALIALTLALALHPLQLPLVQLFEGYWGTSDVARRLWLIRALRHQTRAISARNASRYLRKVPQDTDLSESDADVLWRHGLAIEAGRIDKSYPRETEQTVPFMPTRLGNILRRYEMEAGAPYGIEALHAIPHLALIAPDRDVQYLDDQRATLDMSVRLSAMSLIGCAMATLFLWDNGLWLMIALVPYAMAYLFYRGSLAVAHEYGTAMAALIALNRAQLYARLRLALPPNAEIERKRNAEGLGQLLQLNEDTEVEFVDHPQGPHAFQVDLAVERAARKGATTGKDAGPQEPAGTSSPPGWN